MKYQIELKEPALKKLRKLDKTSVKKILTKIEKLEENPEIGKPLKKRLHGIWQLRTGKYRIWYTIKEETIYIRAIQHKKQAEKRY